MSKVNKRIKLNNNGSTLALTLVAIALISILASVILAASAGNIIMKKIDTNAKSTFYTAESIVDEIKTGVGRDSINSMATAYEKVLSNLIITNGSLDYMMDNTAANDKLKELFMDDMTKKLVGDEVTFSTITEKLDVDSGAALDKVKAYLSDYINKEDYDNEYAKIKKVDSITFIKDYNGLKNQIIINDVVVNYISEKNSETYFADVTMDLHIEYPNMNVDFTATKRLKEFKEFALVADGDVILTATSSDITAKVNAGIYAGGNINIESGTSGTAEMIVGKYTDASGNEKVTNIVTRNNLLISGSESSDAVPGKTAKLSASMANIWCTNIQSQKHETATKQDITAGVEIIINADCKTFVKDDLNVNGRNSFITIGGEYYGYSYDGTATDNLHGASSAIIIDGGGSVLNLGTEAATLKKLVVGGHSYITYGNSSIIDYMTGESLSFRGDQELYLIPAEYIGVGHTKEFSNPMPKTAWESLNTEAAVEGSGIKAVDVSTFFAANDGLLAATPYEVRYVGDMAYIYFNFANKDSAAKYITTILSNSEAAPELRDKIDKYMKGLLSANVDVQGSVNIADGVEMYTAGALIETNGASVGLVNGGSISAVDFANISMDLKNRYLIMSQVLVGIPWEDNGVKEIVSDPDASLTKWYQFTADNFELSEEKSTTYNIVDWGMVISNAYNGGTNTYLLNAMPYAEGTTIVVTDNSYTVPATVGRGIIVATGNVYLDHDFKGLIITKGNIKITDNAKITTDDAMIESLMTNTSITLNDGSENGLKEDVPIKDYFFAYKSSGAEGSEDIKIESLEYDDIVGIHNWRKYDDSTN